jgi:hypothetical protein
LISKLSDSIIREIKGKSDWGTLVPRLNVENGIKLGFLLE